MIEYALGFLSGLVLAIFVAIITTNVRQNPSTLPAPYTDARRKLRIAISPKAKIVEPDHPLDKIL